jgi:hypothetical protein
VAHNNEVKNKLTAQVQMIARKTIKTKNWISIMRIHLTLALLFTTLLVSCKSSIVPDPTTTITFQVDQPSNVKLEIENSYNTVVATPVNGYLGAGMHAVSFDANGFPSGVYFYMLECKGTNSNYYLKTTKTMLLIK